MRAAEIELERAHGVIAHLERSHDARGDQPGSPVLGTHLHRLGERLDDAVLNHVMRCRRMDGRAGRKILRHVAHAGENAALVGHSDGARMRLGQQVPADGLRAFGSKAAAHVFEHVRSERERLLGVLGTQAVRVEQAIGEYHQKDGEQHAHDGHRHRLRSRNDQPEQVERHHGRTDHGKHPEQREDIGMPSRHTGPKVHQASLKSSASCASRHKPSMMAGQKLWKRRYFPVFSRAYRSALLRPWRQMPQ